jgi:uncharacterized membrane protein HdeD (DUF308 family)
MTNKKRKTCRPACNNILQLAGVILMAFGATTLCAFLLPVKFWVFILGIVLLLCGILLIYN